MFGHEIKLNFDKNGDVHKTFFGGFFSAIVKILMFWYIIRLLIRIFMLGDPEIVSTSNNLDSNALGLVTYASTNLKIFHQLGKQLNYRAINQVNLRRYIDIYYLHTEYNYDTNNDFRIEVKKCDEKYFNNVGFFSQWRDWEYIVCPDFDTIPANRSMTFLGTTTDFRSKRHELEFQVNRCDNSRLKPDDEPCATKSEIDSFLYDM